MNFHRSFHITETYDVHVFDVLWLREDKDSSHQCFWLSSGKQVLWFPCISLKIKTVQIVNPLLNKEVSEFGKRNDYLQIHTIPPKDLSK